MPASSLFNGSVAAFAVCAADELGLLEAISAGPVDLSAVAADRDLHEPSVRALVEILADAEVVRVLDAATATVAPGPDFDDVWRNKGYFLWLIRGYGEMLAATADLCVNATRAVSDTRRRDGRAIALAGRDYGRRFVDPTVEQILDTLGFKAVADLGCGSAGRIIALAQRYPDRRFIGVEADPGAVEVAGEAVRAAGLTDRVTIFHDDIRHLDDRPEYADVDLMLTFFLGHDLWPRESCLATLADLRRHMPQARDFLFSDTYRSPTTDRTTTQRAPVFTLGFELTHALMGQHVPSLDEWTALFADSVWRLHRRWPLGIPYSDVFHLTPAGPVAA